MKLSPKPFYFMRHGHTEWNAQGKTGGDEPIPLDAKGIAQAKAVQDVLPSLGITHIYCSPIVRAQETMTLACKLLTCPRTSLHDLREWDFGDWVGQTKDEYIVAHVDTVEPPHGETREAFFARSAAVLEQVLADAEMPIIIAHLGNYYGIAHTLHLPRLYVGNCQIVKFSHHHGGWQQEFVTW